MLAAANVSIPGDTEIAMNGPTASQRSSDAEAAALAQGPGEAAGGIALAPLLIDGCVCLLCVCNIVSAISVLLSLLLLLAGAAAAAAWYSYVDAVPALASSPSLGFLAQRHQYARVEAQPEV